MIIVKSFLLLLVFALSLPAQAAEIEAYRPLSSHDLGVQIDYREKGVYKVSKTQGSMHSSYGCTLGYTVFQGVLDIRDGMEAAEKVQKSSKKKAAKENKQAATVLLAHGFFRSQKNMHDLAEHVASWGVPIVTMSLCNSRFWNGYHDRNGEDMVALADKLNLEKVIYSGFSAGGLAAFLATSQDHRAIAYLGLDMVDNFDKGLEAVVNIQADIFALVAQPSSCNAKNNGLEVYYRVSQKQIMSVAGATHCDFEFPFDRRCQWVCGRTQESYDRYDIQSTILGLTTALFRWKSYSDNAAKIWWDKNASVLNALEKNKRLSE